VPSVELGAARSPLFRVLDELARGARPPQGAAVSASDLEPFAGLLYQRSRGVSGLEQLLRAIVPWPSRVEPGVPRRVPLCKGDRSGLGTESARLAGSLVLGEQVWDCSGSLRVHVGPIPPEHRDELQPNSSLYRQVESLISLWCTDPVAWELELNTTPVALSGMQLSARAPQSRLGESCWLGTGGMPRVSVVLSGGKTSQAIGGAYD
jgi:predicted component of type VI protein secretion system